MVSRNNFYSVGKLLFLANCLPCISIWWYCNSVTYVCLGFIMKRIQSRPTCTLYAHVVFRDGAELLRLKKIFMNRESACGWSFRVTPSSHNEWEYVIQRLCLDRLQKSHWAYPTQGFFNNLWCNLCATSFMSTFTRIAHCHIHYVVKVTDCTMKFSHVPHEFSTAVRCQGGPEQRQNWCFSLLFPPWQVYESLSVMLALMSLL